MGSLRVFIACGDASLRLALHMFLDDAPGVSVVGISDRLRGLLNQLKGSEPDVLLLDWMSSSLHSISELLSSLCNLEHRPKTIVFSTRAEDGEAFIAAGADYFITKDAPPDELIPILDDLRLQINHNDSKEKRL